MRRFLFTSTMFKSMIVLAALGLAAIVAVPQSQAAFCALNAKSQNSNTQVTVTFVNKSGAFRGVMWADFNGSWFPTPISNRGRATRSRPLPPTPGCSPTAPAIVWRCGWRAQACRSSTSPPKPAVQAVTDSLCPCAETKAAMSLPSGSTPEGGRRHAGGKETCPRDRPEGRRLP